MKTFFLAFECIPSVNHQYYNEVDETSAHCMVLEIDLNSAYNKASFYIEKDNWQIKRIEHGPIEITEDQCQTDNDNLDLFKNSRKHGIAIRYMVSAKDESIYAKWKNCEDTTSDPVRLPLNSTRTFKISNYIADQKKLKKRGRCLHYDKNNRCNEIIDAHSIQKNQSLAAIATDGQVYTISQNFSDFKDDSSGVPYKKRGINKMSTFRGFCKLHDNELFKPIDDSKLTPTDQQVFLYAYRSLCKEVFAKENALDLLNSQIDKQIENDAISKYLKSHQLGTSFALNNLKRHKTEYDVSLEKNLLYNIEYVLFISRQNHFLAFSGLKYPDFDFMGRQLQDLGNHNSNLDLITFCSAPMNNNEWGILFSWHKSSSQTCSEFMRSFATMIHAQHNLGDLLFRFVVLSCENIAFSPTWWEGLPEEHRQEISTRTFEMIDNFTSIKPDYLQHGLENIAHWSFDQVISNMNN